MEKDMAGINVCIACDDNYSRYAAVVAASILKNAQQDDELKFYILDGGISDENKDKMRGLKSIKNCEFNFVKIDNSLFEDYMKVKTHGYISLPTFYRLKAASLMPEVDRIIYFDCDMVVNSSLKDLFNSDLGEFAIGGVSDIKKTMVRRNPTYVNAGMLVMDLKRIREENIEQQFLDWTREHFDEIKVGDQQIINEVLKGKIQLLPLKWNVQSSNFTNRSSYEVRPNVIHYVGNQKPWKFGNWNYFKWFYREYAKLTNWDEEAMREDFSESDKKGLIGYFKYRPMFFLRPRFYEALLFTYIIRR